MRQKKKKIADANSFRNWNQLQKMRSMSCKLENFKPKKITELTIQAKEMILPWKKSWVQHLPIPCDSTAIPTRSLSGTYISLRFMVKIYDICIWFPDDCTLRIEFQTTADKLWYCAKTLKYGKKSRTIVTVNCFFTNWVHKYFIISEYSSSLPTDSTCKLDILGHNSNTFSVNCTQICVFEKSYQISFTCFLENGMIYNSYIIIKT